MAKHIALLYSNKITSGFEAEDINDKQTNNCIKWTFYIHTLRKTLFSYNQRSPSSTLDFPCCFGIFLFVESSNSFSL